MPAKPLSTIALSDADAAGALMFVKLRLREAGVEPEWTAERTERVERLGGRASDLASVSTASLFIFVQVISWR